MLTKSVVRKSSQQNLSRIEYKVSSPVACETESFDDSFWWAWMCSYGEEETEIRRNTFINCVLLQIDNDSEKFVAIQVSYLN